MSKVVPARRDVIIVGGGQAGLATGYFLRRSGLSFAILDDEPAPGGAWRHGWPSLRLFSPAQWSSLPGWPMASTGETYPSREDVIAYLAAYERRYDLPVVRPCRATAVTASAEGLQIRTQNETWDARAVVSATGTWNAPFLPPYPGQDQFRGVQVHSAHYAGPQALPGSASSLWAGAIAVRKSLQRSRRSPTPVG